MFASSSKLIQASRSFLNAAACPTSSKAGLRGSQLPPIQYHIFKEPLPYPIGLDLQTRLLDYRISQKEKGGGKDDVLLLLEHTPTYTTGRRDNSLNPDTLHPEEEKVLNKGADFYITKRGGQVTYHGPGQLVGYPIFDLNNMEIATRCYVDWLQGLLADYVRSKGCKGILAPHPDDHVGVFASKTEKVASIGIHLRHRITSHGFAMNITPEPINWFNLVTACGLSDVNATSLHQTIEKNSLDNGFFPTGLPSVHQVAEEIVPRFGNVFGRQMRRLEDSQIGSDGVSSEIKEIWDIVRNAEHEASRVNKEKGGWASEPDLSK